MFDPNRPAHVQRLLKELASKDLLEGTNQLRFQLRCLAFMQWAKVTLGFLLFVGGLGLMLGHLVAKDAYTQVVFEAMRRLAENPVETYTLYLGLAAIKLFVGLRLTVSGSR